ncbi:MAG: M56 family metallopeptidase [Blastocatellia bacterium]
MSRISESAVHFLINAAWQIAAIALAASICARILRNASPRCRHGLWIASLLLSLALPVWGLFDLQRPAALHTNEWQSGSIQPQQTLNPIPETQSVIAASPRAQASSLRLDDLLQTRRRSVETSPGLAMWLAIGFGLLLTGRLCVLCRAWLAAQNLRRSACDRKLPVLLATVAARCQDAFGLENISIVFSTKVTTPATIGTWKPVIILPETFNETSEETLATMLGHEMAHIARRDFALNIVYEFLFLPVAFHPFARWLKRQIDRTRELACDDMVTERLVERAAYARSLVLVAGALLQPAGRPLTLGVFDADILEERIMKLTQKTTRLGARTATSLAVCAFFLLAITGIAASTFSFDLRTHLESGQSNVVVTQSASSGEAQQRQPDPHAQAPGAPPVSRGELEQTLSSAVNAQVRAEAACSAGKNRVIEAIPMLIAMLGDDTPIQLIKCWDSGRWNPAIESLKQPSPGEQAAIALASMGSPALEPLTAALNDSNSSVRRNAAWAIGELTNMREGDRSGAVPSLILLLNDSDDWVRRSSARALGEIKDERAAEGLIARLSDGHGMVRRESAWALGEMKEERSVGTLCNVLLSDSQPDVRMTTAWALGEMQDNRAVESLCKALLSDADSEVRKTAAWALGETKDKRAVEPLCNSLRTDAQSEVRKNAAWALGETKDKRAVETLCNILVSDAQSEVRKITAWALGEIQSPKAVSFLKQALSDPDRHVREKAEWAITEIQDSNR